MLLDKILDEKKRIISGQKKILPHKRNAEKKAFRKTLSLRRNILSSDFGIIAEIKRASPSAGVIRENLDVAATAKIYASMHVSGISVLTCEPFFNGRMEDIGIAREVVSIPLLMKDFIIDDYQIYAGRIHGADAVLLILATLPDADFLNLIGAAENLGMEMLLEVHTRADLERVLHLVGRWDNKILGINNRDLDTLHTDLGTTLNLIKFVPRDKMLVISESGIRNRDDIERLKDAGVRGVLVGEVLLKSTNMKGKLKELM